MNDKDCAEAALIETLKESQVMTVRDPGLSTIQESGQHNSFVYTDLRVFFEVVIVPDTSV